MGMHPSQLDRASSTALDHRLVIERACRDGVVTPAEQAEIQRTARQTQDEIELALAFDRIAESIRRTGEPNPYVVRVYARRVPWLRLFRMLRRNNDGALTDAA